VATDGRFTARMSYLRERIAAVHPSARTYARALIRRA